MLALLSPPLNVFPQNAWHPLFQFSNARPVMRESSFVILPTYCASGPIKINPKFSFSVFCFFYISFEPEFGNPSLGTPEKRNIFNFQWTFSPMVDFILWFCTSRSSETWSLQLISQLLLFDAQKQEKVFKCSFSKLRF